MPERTRSSASLRNHSLSKKRRRRKRLVTLGVVGALVLLFLLAILLDSTLYSGKIHAGVTVSGIELGGMTPTEAKIALDERTQGIQKNQVTLASGSKTWTVASEDVGVTIDAATTVGSAMAASRKSNFIVRRFRGFLMYFKHKAVPLDGAVDAGKMAKLVSDIAQSLDVPPISAGLVFEDKKIRIVNGQKGRVVDQKALALQLKTQLLLQHASRLEVPMTVKNPAVLADNFDEALQQAMTMTSDSVTLTNGEDVWTLDTEEIIAYTDFKAETKDGATILVPYLSAEKMAPFIDEVAAKVKSDPVSATFDADGTRAWVVAGVQGKTLDPEKTVEALNAAALSPTHRTAEVVAALKAPKLSTEEAKTMGIQDVLGTYRTVWVGTPDRQINVKITTEYASNVILAPGDEYNFDKQIGPRTAERGYKMAPGIVAPGQLEDVFGGGICQVSTTLFNAAFRAGLAITERKNHSIYIEHYPKGRDATVSAGSPNLRFRNDTEHYILVRGTSDGITTAFVIYGTDDGRKVESQTSDFYDVVLRTVESTTSKSLGMSTTSILVDGQDGKKIKVVRIVTAADGTVIHNDTFISVWPMLPREIEIGAVTATTTTTIKATTTTSGVTTTSGL